MELLEYHLGKGVRAFSTLRSSGGVGEDAHAFSHTSPYHGFNITPYCGDAPEHVAQCCAELSEALGVAAEHIILPTQTHTSNVAILDEGFLKLSAEERAVALQNVDAVVTQLRGLCIGVSTADCVPVLLHDEKTHTVAAVHAGWRGMVAHILRNTVEEMERLGSDPSDIKAVVAPSIGVESFEVGEEVVAAFEEAGFPSSVVARSFVKPHIDLWAAAAFELEKAGVALQNIQIAGVDTYTHSDSFFSARRLGIASGRIFSGILLQ